MLVAHSENSKHLLMEQPKHLHPRINHGLYQNIIDHRQLQLCIYKHSISPPNFLFTCSRKYQGFFLDFLLLFIKQLSFALAAVMLAIKFVTVVSSGLREFASYPEVSFSPPELQQTLTSTCRA